MQWIVEERLAFNLLRISKRVELLDRHRLFKELDSLFGNDPLAVIWDLSEVEHFQERSLGVFAGGIITLRLRRTPQVLILRDPELRRRLQEVGVLGPLAVVPSETEAMHALLDRIPKKYDEFFCKILVENDILTPQELKDLLLMYEREGRPGDFGGLLLREGKVRPEEILETIAHQKTLLGDLLVQCGSISDEDLHLAMHQPREDGEKLGDLLLRLGLVSNEDIYEGLKRQFKRRQKIAQHRPSPEAKASEISPPRSARLGEILLEKRLLSKEDLERSLQLQVQSSGREKLGDILVRLGFVSDSDLYKALLTQYERSRNESLSGEVRSALEALISRLSHKDPLMIRQASEGLLALGRPALQVLSTALRSPSPGLRQGAAEILGISLDFTAIPTLIEGLEDPIPRVRNECYWSLIRITSQGISAEEPARWQEFWKSLDAKSLPPLAETVSSHREEMARLLATTLQEGRSLESFDLEYRSGKEDWKGGHVRLQIRGDGLVHALKVESGESQLFLGRLKTTETQEIFRSFASAGILFVDTARTRDDPGETRHSIALRVGNQYYRRSMLYYRELFQHWNFRSFETRLKDLLRRVSHGAIL